MKSEEYPAFLEAVGIVCMACVVPSDEDPDWDEFACDKCFVRKTCDWLAEEQGAK